MPSSNPQQSAAIVTGHSRGLGEAIATHLLAQGIRVLGISRRGNDALARRFPDALREAKLDLSDTSELADWLASEALGEYLSGATMPLLVNNAGMIEPMGAPQLQELDLISRTVAVNVAAVLMLTAAFTRATTSAVERRVLQISSGAGRTPRAGWSVYCSTKAALDHHARCVALDAPPGLRISSVAPGLVDTAMQAEIRATTDERFPDRHRFVTRHRDNEIPAADSVGGKLVAYLLSNAFGAEPVFDLSDFKS